MQWSWRPLAFVALCNFIASPAVGRDALSRDSNNSPPHALAIQDYKKVDPVLAQRPELTSLSGCPASGIVAFTVAGTNHVSSGGPTLLGYSGTYENIGGGWIAGGGTFSAPCPGLYSFSVSFVKDATYYGGTTNDVYVYVMHNGIDKGYAWSGAGAGTRDTGTYTLTLFLQQGDYIQTFVSSQGGATRHLIRYNFTGHLIKPDFKASCREILESGASQNSGMYQVDFDYAGPLPPTWVYCDMTTDGGGWTLVMNQVPTALLTYNFSTINPQNFGSLTATYRLGGSAIKAIQPTVAWVLTDDSNRVYFRPTCVVDWENSLHNKPLGSCSQGFNSLAFSTPISPATSTNGSMGIGQNNYGRYCSIRAFMYNQEPSWPPGAAISCAGTTSQTIRLWFK